MLSPYIMYLKVNCVQAVTSREWIPATALAYRIHYQLQVTVGRHGCIPWPFTAHTKGHLKSLCSLQAEKPLMHKAVGGMQL